MSLRVALLVVMVSLLAFAVGTIGWIGFAWTSRSLSESTSKQFFLASQVVGQEIRHLLEPADSILAEMTAHARLGQLPLGDDEALAGRLAESLRARPHVAWLSYGEEASGRFVGVWRDENGQVVMNVSSPEIEGGRPREQIVGSDGSRAPYSRKLAGGYDPRRTIWFRSAGETTGTVWSRPYLFNEGYKGITVSRALRTPEGKVLGAFTVDFFLKDIETFLDKLEKDGKGTVMVFGADSHMLFAPPGLSDSPLAQSIETWLKKTEGGRRDGDLAFIDVAKREMVVASHLLNVPGGLSAIATVSSPRDIVFAAVQETALGTVFVGLIATGMATLLGWWIAYRISEPLRELSRDLARVGRFELGDDPVIQSFVEEVKVLGDAARRMKRGLRSFGRYVPSDLVRALLHSGREAELGGEPREITIFFSDIAGFSALSERLEPDEVVRELSDYLEMMSAALKANGGTVDKFLGDGILAFFNGIRRIEGHPAAACRAALDGVAALSATVFERRKQGRVVFTQRIGLHVGRVVVGNIGTSEQFTYTAIGDPVNVASRLEGLNKMYGTTIMASGELRAQAGESDFVWRKLDRVAVAGRSGVLDVHELIGRAGQVDAPQLAIRDDYERALDEYLAGDFKPAGVRFRSVAERDPSDLAARIMSLRCDEMSATAPRKWDGIFAHASKG
jgi:adenylate cyclase